MSEIKNATVNINLNEGSINISGSEEFVEKNMERIFAFVESSIGKGQRTNSKKVEMSIKNNDFIDVNEADSFNDEREKYKKMGLYSVDDEDGTISIHRKIPGATNAEKMKNVAFIVLYEKREAIEGSMLKYLCEKQGCWDTSNASAIFERDIENFIKKKKSGRKWTLELTVSGENAAVQLLEGMLSDKK